MDFVVGNPKIYQNFLGFGYLFGIFLAGFTAFMITKNIYSILLDIKDV